MRFILYGNGQFPHCTEVHHKRSLEALGHECRILQENAVPTDRLLREARRADALIWVHSHGFRNPGRTPMSEVLNQLRARGIPTIAYHLDLYVPIRRWQDYQNSPYFRTEYWFTVDPQMADLMNEKGWTKAHFLPAGVLAEECYISDHRSPHANDVIFVGSRNYHPEWRWRPQLIDWLRDTYGPRFTHIGGDGDTGVVRGDQLNRAYAHSKISVGDTLCMGFDYPYYASDRLFECPGRGGFNLFPRISGITDWFTEDREIVLYDYGDFDGLKRKIDYYLEHAEERERIRRAGHERAKREHTYTHRWATILETVFGGVR